MADVPATTVVGNMIITPDLVPPSPAPVEAQAAAYKALAVQREKQQQQLRVANAMREQAAQSRGFEACHEKNRQLAADYGRAAELYRAAAAYCSGIADAYRDAHRSQENIVVKANGELAQAKNAAERQAIIARWHSHARTLTLSAVEAATAKTRVFNQRASDHIAALTSRVGSMPQSPSVPEPTGGGGGIAVPAGREKSPFGDDDGPQNNDQNSTNTRDAASTNGHGQDKRPELGNRDGDPATDPLPAPLLGNPFGSAGQSRSRAGGGTGIQSVGLPGELPSAGGLGSSIPGGGGLGSLGSGGGLSGLTSGAGQLPGAHAAGVGGLPGGAPAAGAPAAAGLSQSVVAGSNAGSTTGSLPPATGIGSPAAAITHAAPLPTAGLPGSGAAVPSAGVAAAGAQAGANSLGAAAISGATPAPVMLPPPGMGTPGAPVTAGGATPVTPAATAASSTGLAPTTGAPAGSAAGSGAAMLVPATVVSAGSPTGRARLESADLATAKALACRLRHDSDIVGYPCIEWAVGVFRADVGDATDCVVMSNEGFGYIPWGVFLPRAARILAADKLADTEFRDRWFSSRDPAQVMTEYAKLRARCGAHLVAVAATEDCYAARALGVEFAVCPREWSTGIQVQPVLSDMHLHRLEALHPDLYARIQRLSRTDTDARQVETQLVLPLAAQMMDAVQTVAGVQCPPVLREMWNELGAGDNIPAAAWDRYKLESAVYYVTISAGRPESGDAVAQRELYRAQWVSARAMELVGGWARRPVPVADMVYAAAAAYPGDFVAKLDSILYRIEAARGCGAR